MNASGCVYLSVVGAVITHAIAATPLYRTKRKEHQETMMDDIDNDIYPTNHSD
jgi:hypothetical protein